MVKSPVARALSRAIREAGSQKAAAQALGISQAYLSDVKRGHREPGEKMLKALGLKRVWAYEQAS